MGLFDNVLNGDGSYVSENMQLSYEEENYIDKHISDDSDLLTAYTTEGYIALTAAVGSLHIMEGMAAVDMLQGKDKQTVMESLADRASDTYDTIKRWATKIWKAIKKFCQKAWNKIKATADKVRAYFTNYNEVLRDTKGSFNVKWAEINLDNLANLANQEIEVHDAGHDTYTNFVGKIVNDTHTKYRYALYGNGNDGPKYDDKKWDDVKAEVLHVTDLGVDKYFKLFLNLGEKNYRDCMSLDKDVVSDEEDKYEDTDGKSRAVRDKARTKVLEARARLQLRQIAVQLLNKAANQKYAMCVAAARKAINHKHGVKESSLYSNDMNGNNIIGLMI